MCMFTNILDAIEFFYKTVNHIKKTLVTESESSLFYVQNTQYFDIITTINKR